MVIWVVPLLVQIHGPEVMERDLDVCEYRADGHGGGVSK